MKTNLHPPGKSDRPIFKRLQALIRPVRKKTHRLSANVTGEEDWEVDEPQIRMSRAFAVMLVLHLVAVGGLFAFHVFGKDDREAEVVATRSAHESSTPAVPVVPAPSSPAVARSTPAIPVPPRAEIVEDEPAATSVKTHVFKSGETKLLVAARYKITGRELDEANPESSFNVGDTLVIPPPTRVIGAIADNKAPANPPLALIVATPSEDVGYRDFALKEGADNPYAPVDPAELPEAPRSNSNSTSARTQTVKAQPETSLRVKSQELEEREEAAPRAPKAKKSTPPAPVAAAKPKAPATGSRTHVVGKGDTVYNLAKRYGLSSNEIMRANSISDPSRLQMGQVLKIFVRR